MMNNATQDPGAGGQTRIVGKGKATADGPGPDVMAADTLTGNDVYNPSNEKLGTIEHIMLDVPHGQVAYAVLSHGGVLGVGDKLYAIPWGALVLDTDRKCFVLDVGKDRLKNATGFDKDHWPSMGDKQWAQELYEYYDQTPYW
ncbi:PRC-barrel domain-containing protein [Bordetella petrii]|uniref:PRC-barrel domain-containing protein n=1 Tax=Bordetella petrii TaxID=94624 RepID=UPI001E5C1152|nr:PRC-barrel domain-containing protein [Bordetella petrii]MCD0504439.1 PRC-barrel domain-containing protein [Bordetella petrii]